MVFDGLMMHNWYEGVLQHHFRIQWGFNSQILTQYSQLTRKRECYECLQGPKLKASEWQSLYSQHLPLLALEVFGSRWSPSNCQHKLEVLRNLVSLVECTQFVGNKSITEADFIKYKERYASYLGPFDWIGRIWWRTIEWDTPILVKQLYTWIHDGTILSDSVIGTQERVLKAHNPRKA
ncbi:hypothetical protein VP01_4920g1 [Puccinia sorghi]|uniref:Uncharacterized protein n=1 Tax=Puccinia sorghi TaxID=27349 RepID=A0A0L6UM39_9BASI|nr:hypothetical protein VP01_4920g1 [Puccinia sorghi]